MAKSSLGRIAWWSTLVSATAIAPLAAGVRRSEPEAGQPQHAAVPAPATTQQVVAHIDQLLAQGWSEARVEPAPAAGDGEFLRRASLDLTGVIPRTSEVRAFLADESPDKRALLIERLLTAPRHATHMATTWRNRILPLGEDPERTRDALGLQKWLRTRFAENLRYDRIVGGLLMANGDNELGPALYFQANSLAPDKLAGSAAELFMGVDLHCAQCHDHPFADWTQRDFWGLAAYFARTKSADASTMDPRQMKYRLVDVDRGEVTLPESDEVVPPHFPGEADVDATATASQASVSNGPSRDYAWQSRRSELVVWLTSRDNEFFARATANAAWQHMFGQPLVASIRPLKDERATVQRQVLEVLAAHFVDSGFDIREMWRTVASTRAYALTSRQEHPEAAPELFAHMLPKPLSPEQLFDSLMLLAPQAPLGAEDPATLAAAPMSLEEDPQRIEFVRRMRTPPGNPTEFRAGTLQALEFMNGAFTAAIAAPATSSVLAALDAPFLDDRERVDALFLAALAREPDEAERTACLAELEAAATPEQRRQALGDVLWALINTTEFSFNH